MSTFVQLTRDDCTYLLNLIEEMDSETPHTERQRGYTIPKLQKILKDARSARLAYQDVEYLLDLIEDDDVVDFEQQREMSRASLLEIQALQSSRFEESKNIDNEREARRQKRLGRHNANVQESAQALNEHFGASTKA